jgi:hypothetical protein
MAVSSGESRPRCVVLPIVSKDPAAPGIGMAIHFLFGNVIVLHPAFREFWFGWRVADIFPSKNDLAAYCRTGEPSPEPVRTGRKEEIRFWLIGTMSAPGLPLSVQTVLVDTETEEQCPFPEMVLDVDGALVDLRKRFMRSMKACGHPFPEHQQKKALWPEEASPAGLDAIGRALAVFYRQSAYGGKAPVELPPFERAVSEAPGSFMAHDLLGWALYRNDRHDQARRAFLESVRINAHGAGAMAGLMWCGVMTGDRQEALYWSARKAESCDADIEAARKKAERLLNKTKSA